MTTPPAPDGGHRADTPGSYPPDYYGNPPGYSGYPPGYYGNPGGYYGSSGSPSTNSLAIVSLVCAFLFAPLGILFGHMSLSQIKKTGEAGRGIAIAGLVIGYLVLALTVLVVVVSVVFLAAVARERVDGPRYWSATASSWAPGTATH